MRPRTPTEIPKSTMDISKMDNFLTAYAKDDDRELKVSVKLAESLHKQSPVGSNGYLFLNNLSF